MPDWPDQPWILEINAWTWLSELSLGAGRRVTLDSVPEIVWDGLSRSAVDGVWLMGVWSRSEAARRVSLANAAIMTECQRSLIDFTPEDISGSPYAIREYCVDPHLGGEDGLAEARRQLAARGLCLLLDFVPNHVAPDHPWILDQPQFFVRGEESDQGSHPDAFFRAGKNVIARGRDPNFAPWPDTAQLNAFEPDLRAAAVATMLSIAKQCDGVRCDMAMLFLNRVFSQTWAGRIRDLPATEYWHDLITEVHEIFPRFLFAAEAYWDLETELLQLGFQFCYDKRFYDRLREGNAQRIRDHLGAPVEYQRRLIRFLENHDEPRAATVFSARQNRVAAVMLMTLPGAKLLHEGQFSAAKVKLCVHLGRRPPEPVEGELAAFYHELVQIVRTADLREGLWGLCRVEGWSDNHSCDNLISWSWRVIDKRYVLVFNFSDCRSQGWIAPPWSDLGDRAWHVCNFLPRRDYGRRTGEELRRSGLFVDLDAQSFHFLELIPMEP